MARPEVTGKRVSTTPVKSKRLLKPTAVDPGAIEPVKNADAAPSLLSLASCAHAPLQPLAYSVEQFCEMHNISIGFFYSLLKRGLGPRVMRVGLRTLISAEEAARWRAERTAASSDVSTAME